MITVIYLKIDEICPKAFKKKVKVFQKKEKGFIKLYR